MTNSLSVASKQQQQPKKSICDAPDFHLLPFSIAGAIRDTKILLLLLLSLEMDMMWLWCLVCSRSTEYRTFMEDYMLHVF